MFSFEIFILNIFLFFIVTIFVIFLCFLFIKVYNLFSLFFLKKEKPTFLYESKIMDLLPITLFMKIFYTKNYEVAFSISIDFLRIGANVVCHASSNLLIFYFDFLFFHFLIHPVDSPEEYIFGNFNIKDEEEEELKSFRCFLN